MEDNSDYKNNFPKIEVTKNSVLNMLAKVAGMKIEERDLALDRFKRVNEEMSEDDFWIQGKTAIMYLESASKSSNYLGDMAKDVMKLAYKDESNPDGGGANSLSDDDKKRLAMVADSFMREKRQKEHDQHKQIYNKDGENPSPTAKDPE